MNAIQKTLAELIACPSITPEDAGCQEIIKQRLIQLGFTCHEWHSSPVKNLFARIGNKAPFLLFAGHTDVVAVGDEHLWHTDPFQLIEKEGYLYGRGSADMKGSLAAMLEATQRFLNQYPHFEGSIGFLITSGEEGNEFEHGTPYVMEILKNTQQIPDYCIVGEPSSHHDTGDVIKIGRRGSLSAEMMFLGKQGHVAYPHLAINPIHLALESLSKLTQTIWDNGNKHFPPTSLQITHIYAKGHASNIIPGDLIVHLNIRYSTEQTAEGLIKKITQLFESFHLTPSIQWRFNGNPFLTDKGVLLKTTISAIQQELGRPPMCETSGGTSDGRFIAPLGVEVIELGPSNSTIHQVNECVSLQNLIDLECIYYRILEKIFISTSE